MLTNPDERVLRALDNLSAHDDFKTVLGWLAVSHKDIQGRMETEPDETRLRQQQGASQTLTRFIGLTNESRERLNQIRLKSR